MIDEEELKSYTERSLQVEMIFVRDDEQEPPSLFESFFHNENEFFLF